LIDLPWILKNCSIKEGQSIIHTENIGRRIYVHDDVYWEDDEVTRAVACAGTPGVYFNNTAKCEFSEDTLFALQMRNGNPVNEACFNNIATGCIDDYCKGIFFPSCEELDYFGGFSADTDDPNGYTTFSVSFAGYNTPIAYSAYINTSGRFKLRLRQALTAKTFSITLYNLTNVSSANVYGAETGSGATSVSDNGDGTWNVAHNRLSSSFTGTLDLVFNISFNEPNINDNRSLKIVLAYGSDTNQGTPRIFTAEFSPTYGLKNIKENSKSSRTIDLNGPCGDSVNNDFDYLEGTWGNSYDCYDPDCSGETGATQNNELKSSSVGKCNYNTETNCSDEYNNDYDSYTDCHDPDCFHNSNSCPDIETNCNDGINNDWDYTLGESDSSSSQKIQNNGTKYSGTYNSELTDCEDIDCDSISSCEWGYELTCTDNIDNDALQLKDCEVNSVSSDQILVSPAYAEYDCSNYCRLNNQSNEQGALCDDQKDNDWDAITISGYYSNQYSQNHSGGIDCRWGGYFGYGGNYNPDEECNMTVLSNNKRCELAIELNCTDEFDNDFDNDASGMPNANWAANTAGYSDYFNITYSNDADFDDYDCKNHHLTPESESLNASWCFDNVDNDLDRYYWSGSNWQLNSSTGIDCNDPDCLGVTNPDDENQTCLNNEYNISESFFINLPWPGKYCANGYDDDVDTFTDCADPDCFKQFDLCSKGPCYDSENITWNSCADSKNNDYADGTDCSDHSDCDGMLGSTTGALCSASETICDDNFNNDAQSGVDCADHSDCDNKIGGKVNNNSVYCRATEETTTDCFDGFDNDADNYIDCYDSNCNSVCSLSDISGSNPITLPQMNGRFNINSVSEAYISDYTRRVRRSEWYSITFHMTTASSDAQWTIGTASGAPFLKSYFQTSGAYLSGSDAASFTLTETTNGFIVDSNGASLPSGYTVTFNIRSTTILSGTTFEITYAESTGAKTSLNNYIYHEINEDTNPQVNNLEIIPNSTGVNYGSPVYLRATISDNNQLGECQWAVYGQATFNPSDSTNCRAIFSPTQEGTYYINVTPVDYYSNIGTTLTKSYNLNIIPTANSISLDKTFYNYSDNISINSTFNLVSTDSISECEVFIINESYQEPIAKFNANSNDCYSSSISLKDLDISEGIYSLFIRAKESSENNIIESSRIGLLLLSKSANLQIPFVVWLHMNKPIILL
jgi:hypothetical protein